MLDFAFILTKRSESELTEVRDSQWIQTHPAEAKFKFEVTVSKCRVRPVSFAGESSFFKSDDTAKFYPTGEPRRNAEKYQL